MKIKKFLDSTNRLIISELLKNGRVKYTTLAKKLKVTPAAVKERVERLINKKLIKVSVLLNYKEIFPITATIGVEADTEGVNAIIKRLRNCPLVFHLNRTSGVHNLIVSMCAKDISHMEEFLNKQIRSEPGIRHVEVNIGNMMVVPEYVQLKLFYPSDKEYAPCGLKKDDEMRCPSCPVFFEKEMI